MDLKLINESKRNGIKNIKAEKVIEDRLKTKYPVSPMHTIYGISNT